ncbi:predicted protein [Nematostella vectensis]|uniref:Uncharacterized protein n=1 Tax=Nematostella vectensis TaxID=45351 RepID=A7SRA2_NEMVE|nr:predicted protein [Nematostella vectensis]|eukprot:XP_001625879.1 predicted protein [Nematostella vectensis]
MLVHLQGLQVTRLKTVKTLETQQDTLTNDKCDSCGVKNDDKAVNTLAKNTVFLKDNTIVGDGTTAQVTTMLIGIAEAEQLEARRKMANAKPVDEWRFIFKDYKEHGYATSYTEDSPGLFKTYKKNTKFLYMIQSQISHGDINAVKYADEDLVDLF